MSTVERTTHDSHDNLVARHAARLDACWPFVRVDSVEIVPGPCGKQTRAVVHLGGLVPADVRVELVTPASDGAPTASVHDRMSCNHALANGAFVFEHALPISERGAPSELLIRVRPAEAHGEPRVERHFRCADTASRA